MSARIRILALLLSLVAGDAHAVLFYRITGLTDFNLGTWSISNPAVAAAIDLCVYTSVAGNYSITASSVGGFTLVNGINQIPYSLRWEDSGAGNLGSSGGTALTNNTALTNRAHSNSSLTSNDCSTGSPSGANARLYLDITKTALIAAPGNALPYSGTLVLTIAPP